MKILHINQSDITGGAAIATYRLHQGLLNQGIDSRLLVDIVTTNSERVSKVPPKGRTDFQLYRLTRKLGLNEIHLLSSFEISKHPSYKTADVLNLHNLHFGYFNYLALPTLTQKKPAILTLHDMWAITGHCSYSFDCGRWKTGCGRCPYPDTYPAIERDNTHVEWKLKDWAYRHSNIKAVVTTSQWNKDQAQQSMLGNLPIYQIPYGIDTTIYQPLDKFECRSLLGIPSNKKLLIFGAQDLANPRKGGDLLKQALQSLPSSLKEDIVILTLGHGGENIAESVGIKTFILGFVASDHLKAIVYSAADLFLFPTRSDAFGLVTQEAMSCGTPTIGFKIGGVPDLVRPGLTGYLAEPENPIDFCNGIVQLLEDNQERQQLGQKCRKVVLEEYSLDLQAQRYIELYQQCLAA